MVTLPKYPIYIPSKGRTDKCLTARCLIKDDVPFHLVIEQQEYDQYAAQFGEDCLLVLPFSNQGSVIPARNWIKAHATEAGHERHWQIDDNVRGFQRLYKSTRIPCHSALALYAVEQFTDRYSNIAISGMNYRFFLYTGGRFPPFYINRRVYSISLILNELPFKWRGRYNEDVDLCLQVLNHDWCTVLVNVFFGNKVRTMTMSGGNTDEIYQGDGRLKMARSLQARWPQYVKVVYKWGRPQHSVNWRGLFSQSLKLKKGIDLQSMPKVNEYGMELNQVADQIKHPEVQKLYNQYQQDNA